MDQPADVEPPSERDPEIRVTPRRLIILLGLLAALAVIAFRVPSLLAERDRILQQRRAQAATLAQFAATYSARLYDQSSRVGQDVARRMRASPLTDEQLQELLAARARDSSADDYIVVLDRAGRVRATSETLPPSPLSFASPDFEAHWMNGQQEVIPVLRSRLTGSVIYSLSQRLDDPAGRFIGVVGVNVRPDGVQPTAKRRPTDPLLSVWDQTGRFIAASYVDFDATGQAIAPPKPPGLGIPGSAPRPDPRGLTASAPVQGWPLIAVASYDAAGVLADWRRDVMETAALILLTLLGISALVWLGVKTADRETRAKIALEAAHATTEAALRDRDLLLKEIHHRVKNSLMMTSSLIYLQERRFNDPAVREAFESTRRRLSSIGLVHEALYSGSSLEAVDLAAYLDRLLAELAEGYGGAARGIAVSVHCAPLSLPAHIATPVGLIVAEVVTNAFKHAFAEGSPGQIMVTARRVDPQDVQIEVRDNGAGYPSPDAADRSGLGSRLIQALTEQLHGTASETNEDGAVFRLRFPAGPG